MRLSRRIYAGGIVDGTGEPDGPNWLVPEHGGTDTHRPRLNDWLSHAAEGILTASSCDLRPRGVPTLPALNFYRAVELDNGVHFVSVESGDWTFLDRGEYDSLRVGTMDGQLRRRLENAHVLLTSENVREYVNRLRHRYRFLSEGPTLHILVVTPRCNLTCVYCQASSAPSRHGAMSEDLARKAVERAFETSASSLVIEFQGGEPLLNFPAVRAAIERAKLLERETGKGVQFSLVSNFTEPATEDKLKYLIDANVSVCFSLDGPGDVHDANRGQGHAGCHQAVLRTIGMFRRIWASRSQAPVELRAMMTTTRASLASADRMVQAYLAQGIDRIAIRPVTRLGRGREAAAVSYSAAEFVSFWQQVVASVLETRSRGTNIGEVFLELILKKLFVGESGYMDLRSPCGASFGQVVYDFDGAIYSCDEGRMVGGPQFRIGEVAQPLSRALSSPPARAVLDASMTMHYACDFCAFEPFCGVCPVVHWVRRGTLVPNILEEERCAIFGPMIRHVLGLFVSDSIARAEFERMLTVP